MKDLIVHIVYWIFIFTGYSCIDEYHPKNIQSIKDILVVEGTITNQETVIKLSKSIKLTDYFTDGDYISNAKLYIESSNGERSEEGVYTEKGVYLIRSEDLKENQQYRLFFKIDGEEFASSYLTPIFTPEVDISIVKKAPGNPVFVNVSTYDPMDKIAYYRWSYKEYWEVHSNLLATAWKDKDGAIYYYDMNSSDNKYYCWGTDSSKTFHLASTSRLTERKISQKKIIEMEPVDERLSFLYYVRIEQTGLRKESFDYFSNLQKNMDETGGIFSQMPSEMRGNIECLTHPEKTVIGYIEVATHTTSDRFVYPSEGFYERPYDPCASESTDEEESGLPLYYYNAYTGEKLFAPTYCIDCRAKRNASKNKPDFWPTYGL